MGRKKGALHTSVDGEFTLCGRPMEDVRLIFNGNPTCASCLKVLRIVVLVPMKEAAA